MEELERPEQPEDRLVPPPPGTVATNGESRTGRVTFALLTLFASAMLVWVIWPFRAPLFLAAVLAAVFQKIVDRLAARLGGKRATASALVTLGVFVVIVLPFASIAAFVVREALVGLDYARDQLGVESVEQLRSGMLPPRAELALSKVLAFVHLSREQLVQGVSSVSDTLKGAAPEVLASSGRAAFHTGVMLLALYFLLLDGRRIIEWLWAISPLQARQTEELLVEFRNVSHASIVGTLISAVFQGVAAGIGFALVRIPHAIFLGLVTAVASFIPVVGTAIVWAPAVAIVAATGRVGAAILLGVWCLVLVVGGEHIGKPLLMKGGVEMHTGLVFLSLLGGLEVFGLLGIILGPLIFSFFLSLMRMYRRDFLQQPSVH
jgi:predicted PurR-regulated permease PerM